MNKQKTPMSQSSLAEGNPCTIKRLKSILKDIFRFYFQYYSSNLTSNLSAFSLEKNYFD